MTPFKNDAGIICAGAAALDRIGQFSEPTVLRASNPGRHNLYAGGTARNVAVALKRFNVDVTLLSAVKSDNDGLWIKNRLTDCGLPYINLETPNDYNSGVFTALNDMKGDLVVALADMDIFEAVAPQTLITTLETTDPKKLVYFDTNFTADTLKAGTEAAKSRGQLVIGGVTSPAKARRFKPCFQSIDWLFLNRIEVAEICEMEPKHDLSEFAEALQQRGIRGGVITDGVHPLYWFFDEVSGSIPIIPGKMVNSNGAGDALASGTLAALISGLDFNEAVKFGVAHGSITIETREASHPNLTRDLVQQRLTIGSPQ